MDDDLSSLRNNFGGENDLFGDFDENDDLFSGFSDPADMDFGTVSEAPPSQPPSAPPVMPPSEPARPATDEGGVPDWLRELSPEFAEEEEPEEAIAEPAPAKKKASTQRPKRTSSGGMTPQQRMVLSIFLFLDVAVLGIALLAALGVIGL